MLDTIVVFSHFQNFISVSSGQKQGDILIQKTVGKIKPGGDPTAVNVLNTDKKLMSCFDYVRHIVVAFIAAVGSKNDRDIVKTVLFDHFDKCCSFIAGPFFLYHDIGICMLQKIVHNVDVKQIVVASDRIGKV